MKNWSWLIPCVLKHFVAQFSRLKVLLDGRTHFRKRLAEEFTLVYYPQGRLMLPQTNPHQ